MRTSKPGSAATPLLALTVGDPAGIGPEIAIPAARQVAGAGHARVIVVGPVALCPPSVRRIAGTRELEGDTLAWIDSGGVSGPPLGQVRAECGAAALAALRLGHELSLAGQVDALVTGPVNKAALHAAGEKVEGQTELLGRWCGAPAEMIGIAGPLRVILATRHMPLRRAIETLTADLVLDRTVLFDQALRGLGVAQPRLAVAGLNPHAGEGGLLGNEDGDILIPAVEAARRRGLDVVGPVSPDAVFAQAAAGKYDGVVALYHDQAFIPLKLLGGERGVTVLAGLPYRRFSPMHGTAFDIVGQTGTDGLPLASPVNLVEALLVASRVPRVGPSRS